MSERYDLVVIGGGTTGIVAATTAAGLGARVALIERGRTGGDCLWTGCVPSKTLLASAARAQAIRTARDFGIEAGEPRVDFGAVMARVRATIGRIGREDSPAALRSQGVEVIEAEASFLEPGLIAAGPRRLRYRTALIGTGSRPAIPPVPGLREADPLTSETVFELERLPPRLAVLGGGATGCELGQAFTRLGSEVTVIEAEPGLLPAAEPFAGALVESALLEEGARVLTGSRVERVASSGGGVELSLGGAAEPLRFDRLLVATGREPVTDGLGLAAVDVETDESGAIVVDRRLRTTGDRIFAGGDVIGDVQLTHVAGYHALIAAANGLFRAGREVERGWTPSVVFTDPEVAQVGLTEELARARHGERVEVYERDHSSLDRAITAGERGAVKLVSGRRGRLLGATIVGPAAAEVVIESAKVIRAGGRVGDVSRMIHVYPSYSEGPARAADDYWRRRLFTPEARRWLRPLLWLLRRIDRPRNGRPRRTSIR